MQCNSTRFTARTLLNSLGFVKNYPAYRPAAVSNRERTSSMRKKILARVIGKKVRERNRIYKLYKQYNQKAKRSLRLRTKKKVEKKTILEIRSNRFGSFLTFEIGAFFGPYLLKSGNSTCYKLRISLKATRV